MFNEKIFIGENYISDITGKFSDDIFSDYDREFIDELLKIDDIVIIEIDRYENDDFNRYFISLINNHLSDLICNRIAEIYMEITAKAASNGIDWDIMDTIYSGSCNYNEVDRNPVYWILRRVDKYDTV